MTYAIPRPQREDQYIGRVDWYQSAKHTVFGRYFIADYKQPAAFNNNLLLTGARGLLDRSQSVALGDTYTITPTILNSFHASWSRLAITRGPAADHAAGATPASATPLILLPTELNLPHRPRSPHG